MLPALAPLLRGDLLMLVKPQFELQPADIGKGGLVDATRRPTRASRRASAPPAPTIGLGVRDYFESAVAGGDGNREYFPAGPDEDA